MKKVLSVLLAVCLIVGCLPMAASAAYTSSWINWSQGASAIGGHMKKYGCRIVAQAKLLKEAGILEGGVNPDSYGKWANAKGYFAKGKSLVNKVTEEAPQGTAPVAYAKAVGKTLTYGGQINFSSSNKTLQGKQIMEWLKQGYYVIVGCNAHHAYIPRQKSLDNSTAYISESQSGLTSGYVKKYTEYSAKSGGSPIVFAYARLYKIGANPPPPQISVDVVTGSASNISSTGATLAGSVLPKGAAVTEIGLHFGTSKDNLPWVWSEKINVNVGSSYHLMQSTSAFKTLQPNTTYYYMLYAYQNGQYQYGSVKSFTTKANAVSIDIITGDANSITTTGATLTGSIKPRGASVTEFGLHFGTSKSNLPWAWSKTITVADGKSYALSQPTSAFKTLQPNTTYYYMVYAYQNGQYKYGSVKSFTTKSAPISAVSTTGSATGITDTSATLHGSTVVTGGKTTSIGIQMGTSLDNTPQLMGEYLSRESYEWDYVAKNLKPGTTYYYRVFSSVNGQFFFGKYEKFTTLSAKENTYRLSYYYYSGSQKNGYEEKTSEELPCRFVVRNSEETRNGYIFKGWSWNKNSTIPEYQPGDIVEIEENRTLYAVWESDGSVTFEDVTVGAYYYDAVDWAVENKITSGTSATTFSPNQTCTRAQAVTFLWNSAGKPEPQGSASTFSDVNSGSYYEKAVKWAVENNITSGTGGGKFSPDSKCTRAQIVTFLWKSAGSQSAGGSSFSDVSGNAYYNSAVSWAVENNITSGTGSGKFSPNSNCTRAQIVTFLYKYAG